MGGNFFTVDFPLGKVVVYTGREDVIDKVIFDLSDEFPRHPSRSPEARLVERYLAGEKVPLALKVDLAGESAFRRKVYREVMRIPYGKTRTYGEVAALSGCPGGARGVGQAMAANRTPLIIPCHRVVSAGGKIGGFSSGVEVKKFLLTLEGFLR